MSIFEMSKTIFKSLFSKPATKMYPIKPRVYYKNTRGHIGIEINDCIFCGLCAKACPTAAIAVDRSAKSWDIARSKCVACGACVDVCPKKCLTMENSYAPPVTVKSVDHFAADQEQ